MDITTEELCELKEKLEKLESKGGYKHRDYEKFCGKKTGLFKEKILKKFNITDKDAITGKNANLDDKSGIKRVKKLITDLQNKIKDMMKKKVNIDIENQCIEELHNKDSTNIGKTIRRNSQKNSPSKITEIKDFPVTLGTDYVTVKYLKACADLHFQLGQYELRTNYK